MNQALLEYNQAESEYQMAFQTWSADQSDENAEALSVSEQLRSESQIGYQEAKSAYEDCKTQKRQHRCYPITQEKVQQLCRMGQQEQIFRLIPRTVQL